MFPMPARHLAAASAVLLVLTSAHVWARSSDRNQPMDIDAGATSGTLDDRQPTVLSQGVTIDQGSLHIESSTATLTTRGGEPVRAVLDGSPVRLKQLLDDGTPMSATANRVDYDLTTEIVVFSGNVNIQQPRGTLAGPRVVYNMKTGMVNSNADSSGRVKMRINPRTAPANPPAKPAPKKTGTN